GRRTVWACPFVEGTGLAEIRLASVLVDRRAVVGVRCLEPVAAVADQELGLVGENRPAHADEHSMRTLEIGHHPARPPANCLMGNLDVPRRDAAIERNAKVPLGASDNESMIADADDLAVGSAVVKKKGSIRSANPTAELSQVGLASARESSERTETA